MGWEDAGLLQTLQLVFVFRLSSIKCVGEDASSLQTLQLDFVFRLSSIKCVREMQVCSKRCNLILFFAGREIALLGRTRDCVLRFWLGTTPTIGNAIGEQRKTASPV
jgi:hypothetical protein